MTITKRSLPWRTATDHFEPSDVSDPKAERHIHGKLEQIDYTAYDENRKAVAGVLGHINAGTFEKLAANAAHARCQWVAAAVAATDGSHAPDNEKIKQLAELRANYDELAEAYSALRRMVERGYLRL